MLKGKNAIVTGAGRGIGRATVECFAQNGANIWACARIPDAEFEKDMGKLAEKYNVTIWPVYFDVGKVEEIKIAVQEIKRRNISVDILVNIAGIVEKSTAFSMTSLDKMKRVFDINFFGLTLLTQYISRIMMRKRNGSIIQISSVAGLDGAPAQYEYASSKAAVIGGVKQLARELGDYNIRVNAVAPGIVDTGMGAQIEEKLLKRTLSSTIMKRMAKPEEIANVIAFLASDLSSYVTAQVIRVDGGI